jgi:lysophospholipase L1-like esterase
MSTRRPTGPPAARGRSVVLVLAAIVAVVAVVLAATATSGAGSKAAASPTSRRAARARGPVVVPGTYVALGDSYTSGPAIPTQLGPDTVPAAPAACLRSSENYPSLTARALGLQLTDVSCGGATTDDIDTSQGPGIPAQLSALRRTTALVTVGIGGNDLGFSTIASNCASYTPWGPTRVGLSCAAHYTTGGVDQLTAAVQQLGVKVAAVLARVRQRAPGATVFVIGYPDIVPPTGSGCWPSLPFRVADLGFLRGVEAQLNAALAAAAAGAGDRYVDMATPSQDHSACAAEGTRWVEGVLHSAQSYPLHPNATGMAGMATVLEAAMKPAVRRCATAGRVRPGSERSRH